MSGRKVEIIQPLPMKKRGQKPKLCVSPEDLKEAYTQMFKLQALLDEHIPMLVKENEKKDVEINKLKIMYKLKDDALMKHVTR